MDLSNENIIHIKNEKIEYLQFKKLLEYNVKHAYAVGLDVNFRTGRANDKKISIEEYNKALNDYKELCESLQLDYNNVVKQQQAHTDNIEIVNGKENKNAPDLCRFDKTDGLITNKRNIILASTNADCILLMFYDPVKKVIANIHSGWRGTLQRISVKAVKKMRDAYGCKPKDLVCCMCPSIRKCHFEVDEDVYELFYNEFQDLNLNDIIEKEEGKWHIDTILINKIILEKIGLEKENIIDSGICSVCNKNMIHSCRAEGANYGLSTAIISL